jgi:hypothetical protein
MAGILTGVRKVLGSPFVQSSGKKDGGKQQTNRDALICPPDISPTARGSYPFKVVHSPITETESMENLRSNIFWLKGRNPVINLK